MLPAPPQRPGALGTPKSCLPVPENLDLGPCLAKPGGAHSTLHIRLRSVACALHRPSPLQAAAARLPFDPQVHKASTHRWHGGGPAGGGGVCKC